MDLYRKKKDEELILLIHSGDTKALDFILEKYKNVVKKKARKLFLIGADKEDLIQEGMIGLYKAVRDFDFSKTSSFYAFADLCISRQMYDAIKASNRQKNIPLNTYISFYAPAHGESGEGEAKDFMMDLIYADNKENPESLLIDRESVKSLEETLMKQLSKFERKVLTRYLGGMDYLEIAREQNREPKSVDNALQRIKLKVLKIVKKSN